MPVDYAALQTYVEGLVPPRHPELVAMEAYAREHDFPILGPASCQFCYLLARLIRATQVFELGSGYGYSTAWFARAVDENGGGVVHHTVWDEGLSLMAQRHLSAMGYRPLGSDSRTQIAYNVAEALGTLRHMRDTFDLVFNDIDKEGYPETIEVVYERLRPDGLFITDNVVWGGRVNDASNTEASTVAIREFTRRMFESPRWSCSIVPIRDGLLVARKV